MGGDTGATWKECSQFHVRFWCWLYGRKPEDLLRRKRTGPQLLRLAKNGSQLQCESSPVYSPWMAWTVWPELKLLFFFYFFLFFILSNKQEFSAYEDCILWAKRVLIPPKGQKAVLQELHEGHPGMTRMKALARLYIWWWQRYWRLSEFVLRLPDKPVSISTHPSGVGLSDHGWDCTSILQDQFWVKCTWC